MWRSGRYTSTSQDDVRKFPNLLIMYLLQMLNSCDYDDDHAKTTSTTINDRTYERRPDEDNCRRFFIGRIYILFILFIDDFVSYFRVCPCARR